MDHVNSRSQTGDVWSGGACTRRPGTTMLIMNDGLDDWLRRAHSARSLESQHCVACAHCAAMRYELNYLRQDYS